LPLQAHFIVLIIKFFLFLFKLLNSLSPLNIDLSFILDLSFHLNNLLVAGGELLQKIFDAIVLFGIFKIASLIFISALIALESQEWAVVDDMLLHFLLSQRKWSLSITTQWASVHLFLLEVFLLLLDERLIGQSTKSLMLEFEGTHDVTDNSTEWLGLDFTLVFAFFV